MCTNASGSSWNPTVQWVGTRWTAFSTAVMIALPSFTKPRTLESSRDDVKAAIGITPRVPVRMIAQADMEERILTVADGPHVKDDGTVTLSDKQYQTATEIIKDIFRTRPG